MRPAQNGLIHTEMLDRSNTRHLCEKGHQPLSWTASKLRHNGRACSQVFMYWISYLIKQNIPQCSHVKQTLNSYRACIKLQIVVPSERLNHRSEVLLYVLIIVLWSTCWLSAPSLPKPLDPQDQELINPKPVGLVIIYWKKVKPFLLPLQCYNESH